MVQKICLCAFLFKLQREKQSFKFRFAQRQSFRRGNRGDQNINATQLFGTADFKM